METYKKLVAVTTDNPSSTVSFNYNSQTKEITINVPNYDQDHNGKLNLGTVQDETSSAFINVTLIAGSGITIGDDNSINVNNEYLSSFVANLGYVTQDNDTLYHADLTTINIDGNNTFSVNQEWLDNFINGKGFAQASGLAAIYTQVQKKADLSAIPVVSGFALISSIPVNVSQLTNDAGYLTEHQNLSAYATKDELLVNGTGLTITDGIISIDNDFLSGFVANLGYVTQDSDTIYHADENTILLTSGNVFSINSSWLNNVIDNKGFLTAHQDLSNYALKSQIPTDYLTAHQDLSEYALKSQLPTNYLTAHQSLTAYALKSEIPVVSGFAQLSDIPTVPNSLSAFSNDPGFISEISTTDLKTKFMSLLSSDFNFRDFIIDILTEYPSSGNTHSGDTPSGNVEPNPNQNIPLTFKAVSENVSIALSKNYNPSSINLQYSKNNGTWTDYNINTVINLTSGDTVAFSGNNNHFSQDLNNYYKFLIMGMAEADGNIQSLMNFSNNTNSNCYRALFSDCSGLVTAPSLPATGIAEWCYAYMFENCTSLTSPPTLPATTLEQFCYRSMFKGCSALSTAPQLPALTLKQGCYANMFGECSSLILAPDLPAATLVDECYSYMFNGCYKLSSINVSFINWEGVFQATYYWMSSVAGNGVFYKSNILNNEFGSNRIPEGWTIIDKDSIQPSGNVQPQNVDQNTPLTFTAQDQIVYLALNKSGTKLDNVNMYYNKNNTTWNQYNFNDIIQLNKNETVAFSGNNGVFSEVNGNTYSFAITGLVESQGNVMSLTRFSTQITQRGQFNNLFKNCSGLLTAPQLPASTIYADCYTQMFRNCISLTEAPHLPAETLHSACYQNMFNGCSSLSSINVDFISWDGSLVTNNWVYGVAQSGVFYKKQDLPFSEGTSRIPNGWTVINK